jgi:L-cysteine:1D-myo-inositol 2-amino-2-deoxy-alpha-D-glucopyranoside ligase
MKLFNTLSGRVEPFEKKGGTVTVYVCGITPYDTTHLGHAFTYTTADILIRLLEYKGLPVKYVQNVTDIDDDILRKAGQVEEDWQALGNRWTRHFIEDMQALNVRPPDEFPRATEVIPEIIKTVSRLLESGVAYEAGGSVYFDIKKWPDYGKLSKLSPEEMLPVANERGNIPDDPNKKDPLDFVLWQAKKPGEPSWKSPWGLGRPGWHIECSTMSTCLLDQTVDIHLGGSDLIFPHHESEIAQIEPISSDLPFVRYWMHIAMVRHTGEKMSKSLGNLVMVRDLLKRFSSDALRIYLASHHYREEWDYDEDRLESCAGLAQNLMDAAVIPSDAGSTEGALQKVDPQPHRSAFLKAMDDDLDSPEALSHLSSLAKEIILASTETKEIRSAQDTLRELALILGLRPGSNALENRVISGWNEHKVKFSE